MRRPCFTTGVRNRTVGTEHARRILLGPFLPVAAQPHEGVSMRHFGASHRDPGNVNNPDRRLRYRGPWFEAASSLPLAEGFIQSGNLGSFLKAAARQPHRVIALFALLHGTTSESVTLSDSRSGQILREYFSRRSLGVFPVTRFCRGVLILPRDHAEYLRGRRRQALRTNLRHATEAGIRCELIDDRSRTPEDLLSLMNERRIAPDRFGADALRTMVERPELTLIVARGTTGRPLAIAAALIDDTVCLLEFAMANDHGARWILHDYLVRTLIERRVPYLVAHGGGPFGALGFSPAVQHYQHLLGYELRHLVAEPNRVTHGRRGLPGRPGGRRLAVDGGGDCGQRAGR